MVNFVRYQVSKGKELTEIGEMICDHCLAPDATEGPDIGLDNMTILIVAITHGRSKKEWYKWIAKRVKKKYGYETPSALPQIYTQSRLMAFRKIKETYDKQSKSKSKKQARLQNNLSPGSDENAIGSLGRGSNWTSLLFRLIAVISLGWKNK